MHRKRFLNGWGGKFRSLMHSRSGDNNLWFTRSGVKLNKWSVNGSIEYVCSMTHDYERVSYSGKRAL